jgi:hypothetical protein
MNRTWFTLNKQFLGGLLMAIFALSLLSPGGAGARALAQSCGQWGIVDSPSPGTMDELDSIVAISPQDVWTVGNYIGTQGYNQALIEHWNGRRWINIPSPNPGPARSYLQGVAAFSSNDVWAVGGTNAANWANPGTLIEHWNGTSWSILPSTAGTLSGVSVLSSNNVWAVGVDAAGHTLVEQWNGTQWNIIPSPSPGAFGNSLASVTALSPTDIWAVGDYATTEFGDQALIEYWNGTQWSVVNSPVLGKYPYELRSISAVAANDIWAVGYYDTPPGDISLTLTEHWNGKKWSVVPSPSPTGDDILRGVVAVSSTNIWAVGDYSLGSHQLVMQWNGKSWSVVPSPHRPNTISTLGGISADSAADIWTAGLDINKHDFVYHTLIEHYC